MEDFIRVVRILLWRVWGGGAPKNKAGVWGAAAPQQERGDWGGGSPTGVAWEAAAPQEASPYKAESSQPKYSHAYLICVASNSERGACHGMVFAWYSL